jgi:hypothetical protein
MALLLATATIPVAAQSLDVDVQKGIAQVDDGDYDGAILTLDNAARRLAVDKTKTNDLAQAYLYLGIAYIGKGREAAAKAKFREAVAQIKTLSLSADKFPPKVVDLFEAAKAEETKATAAPSPTPSSSASGAAPPEKKKGGSKTLLIIGGIVVAGGAAALAAGGGSSNSSSSTPPSSTTQTLSFSGTLPIGAYDCKQVVPTKAGTLEATMTWTNGQLFLDIACQEHNPPYTGCTGSTYNRTTNTSATLTAPVRQTTYDICPANNTSAIDDYKLVVKFP